MEHLDHILIKAGSEWTNEEGNLVFKAMKEYGKPAVKSRMDELRTKAAIAQLERE